MKWPSEISIAEIKLHSGQFSLQKSELVAAKNTNP
jgi:hypothetical protein